MTFSAREVKNEELRLRYVELLQRPDVYPTRANWSYISESRMRGLCALLYGKYLAALTIDDNDREELHDVAVEGFPKYLAGVGIDEAVEAIYGDIETNTAAAKSLIRDCGLFDAHRLETLLEAGRTRFVLDLIDVYRREYDEDQLADMKSLASTLDNMPELGHIEERHGLWGRQRRFICPEGHNNTADNVFCNQCGLDIYGKTEADYSRIELLKKRIEALESLIDRRF